MLPTGFYLSIMNRSFSSFSRLFIVCGGQSSACRSQLCLPSQGIKLRSSGTVVRQLYPLSHLARPGCLLPRCSCKGIMDDEHSLSTVMWLLLTTANHKSCPKAKFCQEPAFIQPACGKGKPVVKETTICVAIQLWLGWLLSPGCTPLQGDSVLRRSHFWHPVIERPCILEVLPSSGSERGIPCLLEYAELFNSF